MKRVRGHGLDIQIALWKGQGTPVICVHGLTANCHCWDRIAESLSPGHKVIAMDLRGRGRSDKPEKGYSIDYHCRDIKALIDDLKLDSVALMGHSLGASIVLAFAAAYPGRVDHLVLVDGAGKLNKDQTAKVFAGIKPSLDRLGTIFASRDVYMDMMKQAPFLRPWTRRHEAYFDYEIEEAEDGVRSRTAYLAIQEEIAGLMRFDAARYYKKIKCPTLILRAPCGMLGRDDILLPKNALAKMVHDIPQAWLAEISGTNHYSILFDDIPARDKAIEAFLSS